MDFRRMQEKYIAKLTGQYDEQEIRQLFFMAIEQFSGLSRPSILLNFNKPATPAMTSFLTLTLKSLSEGRPIQYILKEAYFMDMLFKVTEDVLIPRPETEELVRNILHDAVSTANGDKVIRILDVGTGSGCIAVSLKKLFPTAEVWAMDVSNAALKVASENAGKYRTDIRFLLADICDPTSLVHLPVFDLIVSNPPYVTQAERSLMKNNVLDHEPGLALFVDDEDPLRFYDAIFRMSLEHLKAVGRIYFEINEKFGKEMMELAAKHGFRSEVLKDFHEKDRFLFASRHEITIPE